MKEEIKKAIILYIGLTIVCVAVANEPKLIFGLVPLWVLIIMVMIEEN